MLTPRVSRALNPQKRKLSLAQIKAGFGGTRRRASLKANRHKKHSHHKRRNASAAKPSKPKRRATAKAKNAAPKTRVVYKTRIKKVYIKAANPKPKRRATAKKKANPYLMTLAPVVGNPKRKRRKANMAKTKRKASAKGRSGKQNPTRNRRHHHVKHHRRHHRSRNPFGQSTMSLAKTSFGALVGFSLAKKLPPMLGPQANSSPTVSMLTTAAVAGLVTWAAKKVPGLPNDISNGILIGGGMAVVNMLWNAYAPAYLPGYAQYGSYIGVGDFVPGGFPLPNGPVRLPIAAAPMQAPNGSQVNIGAFGRAW